MLILKTWMACWTMLKVQTKAVTPLLTLGGGAPERDRREQQNTRLLSFFPQIKQKSSINHHLLRMRMVNNLLSAMTTMAGEQVSPEQQLDGSSPCNWETFSVA